MPEEAEADTLCCVFFLNQLSMVFWIFIANYSMRNNSVEYVNSVMGHSFVKRQQTCGFIGVAFDANALDEQRKCRIWRACASYSER